MVGVGACAISGGMLTLGTALGVGKKRGMWAPGPALLAEACSR